MAGPRRNYVQRTTGCKVFGTTTITGILDKPALLWWAYKQGLINYEDLCKELASILNDESLEAEGKVELIFDLIAEFPVLGLYEKRDKAANAGTLGHAFVENHLRGLSDPETKGLPKPVIEKAEGCYLTFLDWERGRQLKVLHSELPITSEKRPCGGTLDHVIQTSLTINTPWVEILDLKTGKGIYLEAKIQVGNYEELWNEKYPDRLVKGCHILRLGPNGEFTHEFYPTLKAYVPIFNHCSDIYYLMKDLKEKV
ncbi:MAG: hypothetical protein HWN68_20070 [Desulfobacterales bacterium]|nr:hypothetical protein [Desulfobacterales bacterium]